MFLSISFAMPIGKRGGKSAKNRVARRRSKY